MKHVARPLYLLIILALLAPSPGLLAAASASVDRDRIVTGETVELSIRVDSVLGVDDPDLSPLERNFEVLGTSRNSRVSIINGSQQGYTEWLVTLAPRREGVMQIPSITVDGESTDPIALMVRPDDSPATSTNRDLVLEVDVAPETPYVQQQMLVTVRLLHAVNLSRGAALDELSIDNALVRKVGENSYRKTMGNRTYGVFERVYAVFPQNSGELQIPALGFQANLGGSNDFFSQFRNRGQTVRLRSQPRTVQVNPPSGALRPWLPARNLSLVETWDRDPSRIQVGDSLTRTITIVAEGLTAAQIPPLAEQTIDGLRFYPDQAQLTDEDAIDGVVGTRVESSAVIAQTAGPILFPPVEVRWWNTETRTIETSVIPAKSITVEPSASMPAAPMGAPLAMMPEDQVVPLEIGPERSPGENKWWWPLSSALLALFCALASWQWYRLASQLRSLRDGTAPGAPRRAHDQRESELWKQLRAACLANDAARTRQCLRDWSSLIRPDQRSASLASLPALLHEPALGDPLRGLIGAGYNKDQQPWCGATLLDALTPVRSRWLEGSATGSQNAALPGLYTTRA